MILTVAPGSSGHYMVDEDGLVYTARPYDVVDDPTDRRLAASPGHRPRAVLRGHRPHRDTETGHQNDRETFWIPTGQSDAGRVFEGDEQMEDAYDRIRRARAARELYVERVEAELVTLDEAVRLAEVAERDYLATLNGIEA